MPTKSCHKRNNSASAVKFACNCKRRQAPSKFGLSGKNSARTGKTQRRFLIIGFTREAMRFRVCNALSALYMSLRCVNDCIKMSDIEVLYFRENFGAKEKRTDQ